MKKLLLVLLILIVLVLGGTLFFAGPLIKAGVEKGGTWALATQTELEKASLNVFGGNVGLYDLKIHNPEGFKVDPTFAVGSIEVNADVASFMSDVINVETIDIGEPAVAIEVNLDGTNFGALMDNLEKQKGPSAEPETPEQEEAEKAAGKKFVVGRITIRKPKVTIAQSAVMKAQTDVTLGDIVLENVGSAGEPVDFATLIQKILGAIMAGVANADLGLPDLEKLLNQEAAIAALDDVRKQVESQLGEIVPNLEKGAEELQKELEGAAGGLQKGAQDAAEQAKKGLGGFFGGKKDEDEKKKDE